MEHTPPPFFVRGPAPLVRLAFFASLSLALLVLDARFGYAEGLRSVLALAAYPIQQAARLPVVVAEGAAGFFATQSRLREENEALRARLLAADAGEFHVVDLSLVDGERQRAGRFVERGRHPGKREALVPVMALDPASNIAGRFGQRRVDVKATGFENRVAAELVSTVDGDAF